MGSLEETFRGIVLGVDRAELESVLRVGHPEAKLTAIPPPLALALGIPRKRLLSRRELPDVPSVYSKLGLLVLWTAFAASTVGTTVSFLFGWRADVRTFGILSAVGLGGLASVWTYVVLRRIERRDPRGLRALFEPKVPWDTVLAVGGEGALIVLFLALLFLLITFLLFVVWLPILLLVANLVSLGRVWRRYRAAFVEMPSEPAGAIGDAGARLLERGGVLSESWDVHLDPRTAIAAKSARRRHGEFHLSYLLVGGFSLLLGAALLLSRYAPSSLSDVLTFAASGATIASFVALVWTSREGGRHSCSRQVDTSGPQAPLRPTGTPYPHLLHVAAGPKSPRIPVRRAPIPPHAGLSRGTSIVRK